MATKTRKPKAPADDVSVANHGSVIMVRPISDEAKAWVDENVPLEDWQWMGGAFAVDPHYIENLVDGMRGDGLSVAGA
jgi:hypothetical protein